MYGLFRGVLLRLLRAPEEPPSPPRGSAGSVRVFRASPRFLVLKIIEVLFGLVVLLGAAGISLVAMIAEGAPSAVIAVDATFLGVVLVFMLGRYFLVRLDYDMRYYVVTDRSMRIREGALRIREHTYTYANVQNIVVEQGPIERLLRIANVRVKTAGGGSGEKAGKGGGGHGGALRGIEDAEKLRDEILALLKAYRDAGLGDREDRRNAAPGVVSAALVERLRDVRDEVVALRAALDRPR